MATRKLPTNNIHFAFHGYFNLHFSLELSNGIKNDATGQIVRQGEEDESIAVRGTYSHLGSNGKLYIVDYVADENGFQTRVRA